MSVLDLSPETGAKRPDRLDSQSMHSFVYHVLPGGEPFSAERGGAISRWAGNVLRGDRSSVVVAPRYDETWGLEDFEVRAARRWRIYAASSRFVRLWPIRRRLLRISFPKLLIQLKRADILWIHNRPELAISLAPAVKRARAKLVLHMHNPLPVRSGAFAGLNPLRGIDHCVFVSEFMHRQAHDSGALSGVPATSVIHNGADSLLFQPSTREHSGKCRVLAVGRLVQEKGFHVFTAAMRILQQRGIAVEGVIVGSTVFGGATSSTYIKRLRETAPSNVRFLSHLHGAELAEQFRQSDIFCCPSIWDEPFGMVNVEAMACGLPVVATRSGGIPEIFEHGGGILVPKNAPDPLADALASLAMNPTLRTRIGQEGLTSFRERFTWDAVRAAYHRVLEGLDA